ncbi:MAG: Crp/Fnr family transcriptional regulator [Lachnospiraceae bacterium]
MNRLEQVAIFKQIKKETIQKMWALGKIVKYQKEEKCFRAKEENHTIHIMLEGKAAIYNLTHAGNRKIIFYLGKGELLDDCVTIGSHPSVDCQFVEPSVVFEISKRMLLKLMQDDIELMQAIMKVLERKMWRMGHQLKNTRGNIYLERKLAAKLWKLARDFGVSTKKGIYIDIPLNITELSDFLGAPRETTSRVCKELCKKKLIFMEQKKIYVLSADRMSHFYKHGEF